MLNCLKSLSFITLIVITGCATAPRAKDSFGGEANLRVFVHQYQELSESAGVYRILIYKDKELLSQSMSGKTGPAWFRKLPEGEYDIVVLSGDDDRTDILFQQTYWASPGRNLVHISDQDLQEFSWGQSGESHFWKDLVEGALLGIGYTLVIVVLVGLMAVPFA